MWTKKKPRQRFLCFSMRRSMEPVINVILMPSWEESNRSDRHGQLAIAIHNLGGLYFRVIIFFHSRIEKMNRVAMKWTLSAYSWNQHIVWAWWRARAYRQTHTYTHIISCTQNEYRVDYFIFHFRKTKIGSS